MHLRFGPLLLSLLALNACSEPTQEFELQRKLPEISALQDHCDEAIGPGRVEEVAPGIFMATGYDLANTILIQSDDGNIVVDVSMSPKRAKVVKAALDKVAPGPVRAIIYTHSHIDHVGGAKVWAEADTEIWATDRFVDHFFKQYGLFLTAENHRGARQFGREIGDDIPCSALGRRPDLNAAYEQGVLMPTKTFSGRAELEVGGVQIQLIEAHGETHDQLFVHLPQKGALLPGDNFYRSFPNLYTIRGAAPRPVGDWIASLDAMRALEPKILIPSHTQPIIGPEAVNQALMNYRDGIQWLRDSVVRGANRGIALDALAESVALPKHLADAPALAELYGEIPWSVRAIYSNYMGWFDGKAHHLYPLEIQEKAARYIKMMGGEGALIHGIEQALDAQDYQWALELLSLLEAHRGQGDGALNGQFAKAYRGLATGIANSNGRAYLLQAAHERERGISASPQPTFTDDFVAAIPIPQLFAIMASKIKADKTQDIHRSLRFEFEDHDDLTLTVRRGIAEIRFGSPLPGTPQPVATLKLSSATWRRLALRVSNPVAELAAGNLKLDGDLPGLVAFLDLFEQGMMGTEGAQLP